MRYEQLNLGKVQIGETIDGAFHFRLLKFTANVNPAACLANAVVQQNLSVPGIKAGDLVIGFETPTAWDATDVVFQPVTTLTDAIKVDCVNPTASSQDAAAGDVTVTVLRP